MAQQDGLPAHLTTETKDTSSKTMRLATTEGRGLTDCRAEFLLLFCKTTKHLQSSAATPWSYCVIAAHSTTAMNLHNDMLCRMVEKNNQMFFNQNVAIDDEPNF